jgi:zinc protease
MKQTSAVGSRIMIIIGLMLFAMSALGQEKPSASTNAAAKKPVKMTADVTGPRIITLASTSPLYIVKIMVRTGSIDDPAGKEGLAGLLAQSLIEGGFGDPKNAITKEKLAEITRPWGSQAMPAVRVDKQTTTISMTVPRDVFPQFVNTVLKPMLTQPLFLENEVNRLRTEALTGIQSRLRMEQQEMLGLQALESYIFEGTELSPLSSGTVRGLMAIKRDDLLNFYKQFYTSRDAIATNADAESVKLLEAAVPMGSRDPKAACDCSLAPTNGREVLIVTQPNAIATGIHLGFQIEITRRDPDYCPLFVANTYLGAHRDSFGRLYQEIREARGYNYGDYSYIEYLSARPYSLFPPPGTPRTKQYFSIWIRPVGHQYAHFVLKAATAELERLIKEGLTAQQVEEARIKARTLYLNYAENTDRQLGYRLDDAFYRMGDHGYLVDMLKNIDAVTAEQVNAAIRKHLQVADVRYAITTNEKIAGKLADDIANNIDCTPKTPAEYHIAEPVPPDKQKLLEQDRQWVAYPLNIKRANIHIVKSDQLFETADVLGKSESH